MTAALMYWASGIERTSEAVLPLSIGSAAFVIPAEAGIQDDWLQVDVATHR